MIPEGEGEGGAPSLADAVSDEGGTDPNVAAYRPADDPGLGDGGARPPDAVEEVPPPSVPVSERLPSILESLLLVADRPLPITDLAELVGERDPQVIESALVLLATEYTVRGIQIHPVAGGWQIRTNPMNSTWVQRLLDKKPVRLTRAQLETLAIVGYRQPITRPEIDEIRGVDSGGTLKTLLDRSLTRILGKKEEPGRPLLYGTTKEFLEFFNLRDLADLPTLREFHELSEEHQAQVAALEHAAPPGTIEPADAAALEALPPRAREIVNMPNQENDDQLASIGAMIDEAGARAEGAAKALGVDAKAQQPEDPPAPEGETVS